MLNQNSICECDGISFVYGKMFAFNGQISSGKDCEAGTKEVLNLYNPLSEFFEDFANPIALIKRNISSIKSCPGCSILVH